MVWIFNLCDYLGGGGRDRRINVHNREYSLHTKFTTLGRRVKEMVRVETKKFHQSEVLKSSTYQWHPKHVAAPRWSSLWAQTARQAPRPQWPSWSPWQGCQSFPLKHQSSSNAAHTLWVPFFIWILVPIPPTANGQALSSCVSMTLYSLSHHPHSYW